MANKPKTSTNPRMTTDEAEIDQSPGLHDWNFPKEGVVIRAATLQEAMEKLKALQKPEEGTNQ